MKRICFISGIISHSGGTERVGSIIANVLSNAGYEVSVLSFWDHGTPYFKLNKNIKVDYLFNPQKEGKLFRTVIYPIYKLRKYLQTNKIDVVIDIDTVLSYYTTRAIRGTNCKLIAWEHFNYWVMEMLQDKKRFKAKKLIKKYASKLVVLTDEDRKKHIDEYELTDDFVVSMPNPCISDIKYSYDFDNKIFVAVGRLADQKNFSDLIEAWKYVEAKVTDWKLIIVGDGELKDRLLYEISELKLKNVILAGHSDDVAEYYRKASCFVLSSKYEGFPMVILEAQSYGLPVISYDCKTGPRDMIEHGVNGYLVEDRDRKSLASYMIDFTMDKNKAEKMSLSAYSGVQKFNLDNISNRWVTLIENL